MHKTIFHNNRLVPLIEDRLSPGQGGLFNGWGLFTTLRIYNGRPFAFERHWRRLSTDADRIQLPLDYSEELVFRHLIDVVEANHVKEGCARVYFIYNKVGFWCSDESFPIVDLVMFTADMPLHQNVVQLAMRSFGRYSADPLAGVKVTSWLQNVWSLEQARLHGFDEVVMFNERGEVAECTAANLFCVRRGIVQTPPLSAGCLPGITREILLELSSGIGIPIVERPLTWQDLHRAEEVFITSTTREVQPVRQIEEHKVPQIRGTMTDCLAKAFSNYVTQYFTHDTQESGSGS